MDGTMYCLVDPRGDVHVTLDAASFREAAGQHGLDEHVCQEYRFDLNTRQLLVDRGTPPSALAVQEYLSQRVGSPERLMAYAVQYHRACTAEWLELFRDPANRIAAWRN